MTQRLAILANDTFRSLRTRNFRLFYAGQMSSMIGTWMEMVAITWVVLDLTDSGVALGFVTAAQFGPMLLLGAWGGLQADRYDRHRLMMWTQTAYAVLAVLLAVVVVTDYENVPLLYVFSAVWGIVTSIDNPTRRALIIDMVDDEDLGNAVGLNTALMTGSRVVGPALAGVLISGPGVEWCFVVNAVSYVAVIGALLRMDRSKFRSSPRVPRAKGQLREGFRYTRSMPELWLPLVFIAVMGTLAFNYQVTLPLLAKRSLGGDASTFTWLFAAMSVGSVLGALAVARKRMEQRVDFLVSSGIAISLATFALALAPITPLALLAVIPLGYSTARIVSGSNAVMQLRADPEMRGRVLALVGVVFLGSTPIGGPVIGWVSQTFGARAGLAVGGVAVALVTIWVAVRLRRNDVLDEADAAGPEPGDTVPAAA